MLGIVVLARMERIALAARRVNFRVLSRAVAAAIIRAGTQVQKRADERALTRNFKKQATTSPMVKHSKVSARQSNPSHAVPRWFLTLVLATACIEFFTAFAQATTYTVKGTGGNFTTISACAAVAVAGDSCVVYASASPQSGWTQVLSGTDANHLITFVVNSGDVVNATSAITLSGTSYVRISGFTLTLPSGRAIVGNNNTAHNQIDHNTAATTLFYIPDSGGGNGSDNIVTNNTINLLGHSDNAMGFYVYGDRNLFDSNIIENGAGDCFNVGGTNVVIRNNSCHDISGVSGEHIDFVQVQGAGLTPTLSYSLIENNTEQHCYNDGGNCHFLIIRTGGNGTCPSSWSAGNTAAGNVVRFNYAQNLNGTGISFGGVGDCVPYNVAYNNTIATESESSENGDGISFQNAPYGGVANNIFYDTVAGPWSPTGDNGGGTTAPSSNGDLVFTNGYLGSWNAPYASEPTYASMTNQNPLFVNYPTDATLQAASPAAGTGVALTMASGSGSNSKSLTVVNAHYFQSGWAGTQADWIRIGSNNTVQISSINYSTNVITLATSVSWNSNDPVYLYRNSNGTVVLNGAKPDIGAFDPPASSGGGPSAPSGLSAVVN